MFFLIKNHGGFEKVHVKTQIPLANQVVMCYNVNVIIESEQCCYADGARRCALDGKYQHEAEEGSLRKGIRKG